MPVAGGQNSSHWLEKLKGLAILSGWEIDLKRDDGDELGVNRSSPGVGQ
jgi:hypothetical protein